MFFHPHPSSPEVSAPLPSCYNILLNRTLGFFLLLICWICMVSCFLTPLLPGQLSLCWAERVEEVVERWEMYHLREKKKKKISVKAEKENNSAKYLSVCDNCSWLSVSPPTRPCPGDPLYIHHCSLQIQAFLFSS